MELIQLYSIYLFFKSWRKKGCYNNINRLRGFLIVFNTPHTFLKFSAKFPYVFDLCMLQFTKIADISIITDT